MLEKFPAKIWKSFQRKAAKASSVEQEKLPAQSWNSFQRKAGKAGKDGKLSSEKLEKLIAGKAEKGSSEMLEKLPVKS